MPEKSRVNIQPGNLAVNLQECESVLRTCPNIYCQEGRLVRLFRSGDSLICKEVDVNYLNQLLSCNGCFRRKGKSEWILCDCPDNLSRALLAKGDWKLPEIKSVVSA